MKAITWLASLALGVTALSSVAFSSELEGWSTDLDKALETAKKEKKSVLVEFTGSDWCPPCIAMRKNVFSKKEFVTKASEKFVLVELDFPKGDQELAKKNQPLAQKYKVEAFPTVVLLDSDGKEFSRFFASQYPTTEAFLAHLEKSPATKATD